VCGRTRSKHARTFSKQHVTGHIPTERRTKTSPSGGHVPPKEYTFGAQAGALLLFDTLFSPCWSTSSHQLTSGVILKRRSSSSRFQKIRLSYTFSRAGTAMAKTSGHAAARIPELLWMRGHSRARIRRHVSALKTKREKGLLSTKMSRTYASPQKFRHCTQSELGFLDHVQMCSCNLC
jgi:hypothetical protein